MSTNFQLQKKSLVEAVKFALNQGEYLSPRNILAQRENAKFSDSFLKSVFGTAAIVVALGDVGNVLAEPAPEIPSQIKDSTTFSDPSKTEYEVTTKKENDTAVVQIDYSHRNEDIFINWDDDKKLILTQTSPSVGIATTRQDTVIAVPRYNTNLTFSGGELIGRMPDSIAPDRVQLSPGIYINAKTRSFIRAEGYSGDFGKLTFKNKSVKFKGATWNGFWLRNDTAGVFFDNGFQMDMDRTQELVPFDVTGISSVGSKVETYGDTLIDIKAGQNDTSAYGLKFWMGGTMNAQSKDPGRRNVLTINVNGGTGSSFNNLTGVYMENSSLTADSLVTNLALSSNSPADSTIWGIFATGDDTTKGIINLNDVMMTLGKGDSYGVKTTGTSQVNISNSFALNRADIESTVANFTEFGIHARDKSIVEVGKASMTFRSDFSYGICALGNSIIDIGMADMDFKRGQGYGIYAAGDSTVNVSKADMTFQGEKSYGIQATNSSKITINDTFTSSGQMCLIDGYKDSLVDLKSGLISETPSWVQAWDSSTVKVNSERKGVVKFSGAVITEHIAGSNPATTEINLGDPMNSSEGLSYWNVTHQSTVTDLQMGNKSFLNFTISNANKADFQKSDETTGDRVAMLNVTGNNPVVLYDDGINGRRTRITLTLDGPVELNDGDELNLITSNAGFVLNDAPIDENTPLYRLRGLFKVKQNYSLARTTTDDLGLGYKLDVDFLTGGILHLYATVDSSYENIDPDGDGTPSTPLIPLVPATPRINPETDILMESSLSSYGTLAAADDLMVDTVLRSRNGGHEGAFAAARAGRWHFDTSASQKSNITSGLFGYAVQTSVAEVGGWLEIGNASYKVNTNVDDVTAAGSGKHNYAGVGAYANVPMPLEGWFLTGYLKAGALENNFDTVLTDQAVNFDRTSGYWGAHLGTHYDLTVGDFRLRPFVSYFYDGRDSESYSFKGHGKVQGATFHYDKLNAHRVQAGTFAEYHYSEQQRPYIGLTYEQVLSAKAKGYAVDGYGRLDLNSSDMEGGTGILSAGWTYVNLPKNFSCEFGMNGFAGTRRGVSAQIQADWRF